MVLYNERKPVDAPQMICCAADKHAHGALKLEKSLPAEKLKPNAEIFIHPICFARTPRKRRSACPPADPFVYSSHFANTDAAVSVDIHALQLPPAAALNISAFLPKERDYIFVLRRTKDIKYNHGFMVN